MSALPRMIAEPQIASPPPVSGGKRKPLVSILLITYNHAKYIGQAIESILMQETEFDYEINVIEDCSTDGTQAVIMDYARRYPDKVKPYCNEKNIGFKVTQKNFVRGMKICKGDYLAILEGDDYWTSPHKLQKQVAFLEANPDYVACAHNTVQIFEDGSQPPQRFLYSGCWPEDHTLEDMIYIRSFFHTTTLMYRNVFKGNPPKQFINPWSCDIFITIAHAQYGKIRYYDEDMAVYRIHPGGRFSGMKQLEGWFFNVGGLRRYNQWLGYRHMRAFCGSIVRYCDVIITGAGQNGVSPLKWHQKIKYLGIRLGYNILFQLLDAAHRLRLKAASERDSYPGLLRLWQPLHYLLLGTMYLIIGLFNILFDAAYSLFLAFCPPPIIEAIRRFETRYEGLQYLRVLIREGKLLTHEGKKHCAQLLILATRKLVSRRRKR